MNDGVPRVPTFDDLLWPTLAALKAIGGSATNAELLEEVIKSENYPEEVYSFLHTDHRQTKLNYNLAWAKTYLRNVGAIENSSRGVWSLTDSGDELTAEDCAAIPARVRKEGYERRKLDKAEGEDVAEADPESEDFPSEDTWKDLLLRTLFDIAPDAFERLAQRILREAGFSKVEVTGRPGDGGIDGLGVLRVNLLSFQVLFQCKRYQGTVGAPAVRDFRGAMIGRCDKGLVITTGTFSSEAVREATRDGAPAIDLIDGDQLCDLLKALNLGVQTETQERVTIDQDWFRKI